MKIDRIDQGRNGNRLENLIDPRRCFVRLRDAGISEGASRLKLEQQLSLSYTVIVPLGGSGTLELGDQSMVMKKDHAYFCPPECTFGWSGDGSGELSAMIFRLDIYEERDGLVEVISPERMSSAIPMGKGIPVTPAGRLEKLCRAIQANVNSRDRLKGWRAHLDCCELLFAAAAATSERTTDTREALERSKAYMEERFVEEITINQLAAIAELSPKYYVDLFKKTYGVSALDHLTKLRMDKAKLLMTHSDRLLKDIACEVGYPDPFYFSRKFKQTFGLSPSQYMKQRSRRLAVYGRSAIVGYLLAMKVIPHAAPLHPMWSKLYYMQYGSDIPFHLNAVRQNYHRSQNLELIAQSKPELIITHQDLEQWERERLTAIAPIVELQDEERGWKEGLLALAEVLGERSEAHRWIEGFESKLEHSRQKLSHVGDRPRVLTLKRLRNQFFLFGNRGMHDVLYDGLGVRAAYEHPDPNYSIPISLEEIDHIEADTVLLLICRDSETLEEWKALQQSTAWLTMRMVRDNKLHQIPSQPWREYSPLALEQMIDEAMQIFYGNCP